MNRIALVRRVRARAHARCEYCRIPESCDVAPFHVDHVIPSQHGGATTLANLAFACYSCNLRKGPNLAGRDPKTKKIARLYNPRRATWAQHFRWAGARVIGITAVGRATVATLGVNKLLRLEQRRQLMAEGRFMA